MSFPTLARGDIVLAAFPYTDLSMQKRRPALVLNENTDQGDVILAFISSQIPSNPPATSLLLESFDSGIKDCISPSIKRWCFKIKI